jgi:hypothetical protein
MLPFILLFMVQSVSAVEPFSTYTNSRFNISQRKLYNLILGQMGRSFKG